MLADSEGPDQTARMYKLIWAFTVRIWPKKRFCIARPIQTFRQQTSNSIIKWHSFQT